jgi:hypothetical protein
VAVMVRGLLANILSASELDTIFRETAVRQREGELLFSSVVELLQLVVTKSHKSMNAAYLGTVPKQDPDIPVSKRLGRAHSSGDLPGLLRGCAAGFFKAWAGQRNARR